MPSSHGTGSLSLCAESGGSPVFYRKQREARHFTPLLELSYGEAKSKADSKKRDRGTQLDSIHVAGWTAPLMSLHTGGDP